MSEENTKEFEQSKSFEERVFLRFDAVDDRLNNLDFRVERLEARQYDTRPIWERLVTAIDETKESLLTGFSEVNKKLGVVNERLEGIDQRLNTVDQRLDTADRRFDTVDQRLAGFDARFDKVDERFAEVDHGLRRIARSQDTLNRSVLHFKSDQEYLEGRLEKLESVKPGPD